MYVTIQCVTAWQFTLDPSSVREKEKDTSPAT